MPIHVRHSQEQRAAQRQNGHPGTPPLQSGDQLTRAEFERRYHLHPEIKKAELIEGEVYVTSPVQISKHAAPHFDIITWLGLYRIATPGTLGSDNGTVRLDLKNEPQPDALLRLDPAVGGRSAIDVVGVLQAGLATVEHAAFCQLLAEKRTKNRSDSR